MLLKGFALLISVLTISAIALSVIVTSMLITLGALKLAEIDYNSSNASSIVEGCVDEALLRIRLDNDYSGGQLITVLGNCNVNVSTSANEYTFTITNQDATENLKTLEIKFNLIQQKYEKLINITSWKEI